LDLIVLCFGVGALGLKGAWKVFGVVGSVGHKLLEVKCCIIIYFDGNYNEGYYNISD
jgi:hypothetical protein